MNYRGYLIFDTDAPSVGALTRATRVKTIQVRQKHGEGFLLKKEFRYNPKDRSSRANSISKAVKFIDRQNPSDQFLVELWQDNNRQKKYTMTVPDLAAKFKETQWFNWYIKGKWPFDRCLRAFISSSKAEEGLSSVPEMDLYHAIEDAVLIEVEKPGND